MGSDKPQLPEHLRQQSGEAAQAEASGDSAAGPANPLEELVVGELRRVTFPGMTRDIVSFGFVQFVGVDDQGRASVRLRIPTHNPGAGDQIQDQIEKRLSGLDGISSVEVVVDVDR